MNYLKKSSSSTLLSSNESHHQKATGWEAQLDLNYRMTPHGVDCNSQRHTGPLQVHRPLYPEGRSCAHSIILHPPGGVVGGDRLSINVQVEKQAAALISAPSANRFYRVDDPELHQQQDINLTVEEDAALDWTPLETLYFEGSRVRSNTTLSFTASSKLIGWEIAAFGRPGAGVPYGGGKLTQTMSFVRDGKPLLHDRTRLDGASPYFDNPSHLMGFRVMASFWVHPATETLLQDVRAEIETYSLSSGMAAATLIDGMLICRCLTNDSRGILELFFKLWQIARRTQNRSDLLPRIWMT